MFKFDERVYFLKDNYIQSGLVLGYQKSEVKGKNPQTLYLIGKEVGGNLLYANHYFDNSRLSDYTYLPAHLVFKTIDDLSKFYKEQYEVSKGIKQPF